jgi:signal peptidase II
MRLAGRAGLCAIVLATVGCDHATKYLAGAALAGEAPRSYLGNLLRLSYAENPGGFLSIGAGLPPGVRTIAFTLVTGLILFGLTILIFRRPLDRWTGLGLSLFVAGGLSNWIDRVLRGSVIDFLNLGLGSLRTGIFNVADVAIVVGAGFLLLGEYRKRAEAKL